MSLAYSFRLAVQSLMHEKWINILSVLTIAAGLFITALTLLSIYNLDTATRGLPDKFSVMLYLNDNLTRPEIDTIIDLAGKDTVVEKVKYIPKDEALKELKSVLRNTEYVLDGLGENPLPDTIEIKLKKEILSPESVRKFVSRLRELKGIHEIDYGEKLLSSIYSLRVGMNTIGIVFVLILSAGMLFVCYSTVKILFYRKQKEIETYTLLGATKTFIRAPFLIEGAVIGFCGGILSLAGMLALYYFFILRISMLFPIFTAVVFPVSMVFTLPFAGLILGISGALIAIGRIRY